MKILLSGTPFSGVRLLFDNLKLQVESQRIKRFQMRFTHIEFGAKAKFEKLEEFDKKILVIRDPLDEFVSFLFQCWNPSDLVNRKKPDRIRSINDTFELFKEFEDVILSAFKLGEKVDFDKILKLGLGQGFILQQLLTYGKILGTLENSFLGMYSKEDFVQKFGIFPPLYNLKNGNILFSFDYYLNHNPDVKKVFSRKGAIQHYLRNGIFEGRFPSLEAKEYFNKMVSGDKVGIEGGFSWDFGKVLENFGSSKSIKQKNLIKELRVNIEDVIHGEDNQNDFFKGFQKVSQLPEIHLEDWMVVRYEDVYGSTENSSLYKLFGNSLKPFSQPSAGRKLEDLTWVPGVFNNFFEEKSGASFRNIFMFFYDKVGNPFAQTPKPFSLEGHGKQEIITAEERSRFETLSAEELKNPNFPYPVFGENEEKNTRFKRIEQFLDNLSLNYKGDNHYGFNPRDIQKLQVIVYSGGKTGSTSFETSFKDCTTVLRLHSLGDFFNKYPFFKSEGIGVEDLAKYIFYKTGKKLLVFSIYRDPVSRSISSFFEDIETKHIKKPMKEILKMGIKEIERYIWDRIPPLETYHPHHNPSNFGVNIFDHPFNHEKGFRKYSGKFVDVLLIHFKKIRDVEKIVRQNTQFSFFKVTSRNLSGQKAYKDLYRKFNKEYQIPLDLLEALLEIEDQNLKYFHEEAELNDLKKQWYTHAYNQDRENVFVPERFDWKGSLNKNNLLNKQPINNEYYARRQKVCIQLQRNRME